MTPTEVAALIAAAGAIPGDALFFGAGETHFTQELMGALRVALARQRGLIPQDAWNFVWVTQWPMFEQAEGRWDAVHHPFTAPTDDWADSFDDDPGAALSRAYDLALNGIELGGGSIRIHRSDMQSRVFALLGIGAEEAEEKFGFLLKGLSFGAPPHGGVAFGLDRLAMLMAGASSLREVIAFPKTASGSDPLTAAPGAIDDAQLAEVGLRRLPPPVKS